MKKIKTRFVDEQEWINSKRNEILFNDFSFWVSFVFTFDSINSSENKINKTILENCNWLHSKGFFVGTDCTRVENPDGRVWDDFFSPNKWIHIHVVVKQYNGVYTFCTLETFSGVPVVFLINLSCVWWV